MLLDLIDLKKIRKAILYLICIVLCHWFQTMVLSRAAILGAAPLFLPALAVAIGMWEGGVWGGVLGLVSGGLLDAACSDTHVLFTLLFLAFGFFAGLLAEYFINRRFLSYVLLSALALLLTAFVQIAPLWLLHGSPFEPLARTALLQALWSLPFALPVYPIVRAVAGRARETD